MTNLEQELKLILTERQYNLLVAQERSHNDIRNHYFCSTENNAQLTLRIREQDGEYTLTYKQGLGGANGVKLSREYNACLTDNLCYSMISLGINMEQIKQMLSIDIECDFDYIGYLDVRRSMVDIEGMSVEVDRCSYLGEVDYELEYECNDLILIDKLKSVLLYKYVIASKPSISKSARFLLRFNESK